MEPLGAFCDEEFHSFSKMFSNVDADFVLHMHDHDLRVNDRENGLGFEPPSFFPANYQANNNVAFLDNSLFSSSSETFNTDYNCLYISQESSYSTGIDNVYFPNPSNEDYQVNDVNFLHVTNDTPESMEFYGMDNKGIANAMIPNLFNDSMDDILNRKEETLHDYSGNADCQPSAIVTSCKPHQLKRKSESPEDILSNGSFNNVKKKSRVSRDTQKSRKNTQPKKNKKIIENCKNEDDVQNETNEVKTMQSSSPSMSDDDDSNASQELSDSKGSAILNSNGKKRATRGSATDSQSLYARKRRERINERLKILQNIIPNGTKVDISTMLEEAVQYVKFLQLQIQLLSSDDLWMYAPIAYNGMDIGSYQKIFPYL